MYKYTEEIGRITGMVKCPECTIAIEPDQSYCGGCGKRLQSKLKIAVRQLKKGNFRNVMKVLIYG